MLVHDGWWGALLVVLTIHVKLFVDRIFVLADGEGKLPGGSLDHVHMPRLLISSSHLGHRPLHGEPDDRVRRGRKGRIVEV